MRNFEGKRSDIPLNGNRHVTWNGSLNGNQNVSLDSFNGVLVLDGHVFNLKVHDKLESVYESHRSQSTLYEGIQTSDTSCRTALWPASVFCPMVNPLDPAPSNLVTEPDMFVTG